MKIPTLTLSFGAFVAVLGGESVAFGRYLNTPVPKLFWWAHTALLAAFVVFSQWQQWRRALRDNDTESKSPPVLWREAVISLTFALSLSSLFVMRELAWAAPTLALCGGLFCWLLGRIQKYPFGVAVSGWLLAGIIALLLPWANEHRLGAVEFIGGLAMAMQGSWDIVKRRRATPLQS